MRQKIHRAMHQPDDLVIEFDYTDAKGVQTHRVIAARWTRRRGAVVERLICRSMLTCFSVSITLADLPDMTFLLLKTET
jgi:hypothetical protein